MLARCCTSNTLFMVRCASGDCLQLYLHVCQAMRATERGKIAGGAMRQRGLCACDVIRDGRHLDARLILTRTQDLGQHIQLLIAGAQLQICPACIIPNRLTGNDMQQKLYLILCIASSHQGLLSFESKGKQHQGQEEAGSMDVKQLKPQARQPRRDGEAGRPAASRRLVMILKE